MSTGIGFGSPIPTLPLTDRRSRGLVRTLVARHRVRRARQRAGEIRRALHCAEEPVSNPSPYPCLDREISERSERPRTLGAAKSADEILAIFRRQAAGKNPVPPRSVGANYRAMETRRQSAAATTCRHSRTSSRRKWRQRWPLLISRTPGQLRRQPMPVSAITRVMPPSSWRNSAAKTPARLPNAFATNGSLGT